MKAQVPTPRQQHGGGGHVLGAPGKLVEFSETPFPHLGSRVALPQRTLNTEEVKGAGSGERHWVIRDQLLANCRLARSCSQGATSLQLLAACCQGEAARGWAAAQSGPLQGCGALSLMLGLERSRGNPTKCLSSQGVGELGRFVLHPYQG